jgi:1,2-diacylglycerol 3-alpha-glucosyltransferase
MPYRGFHAHRRLLDRKRFRDIALRIAVIFYSLGPYHVARLGSAAARCDLLAIEVAGRSVNYDWNPIGQVTFARQTLFPSDRHGARNSRALFDRILSTLRAHNSEVVAIPGWSGRHAAAAMRAAIDLGAAIVVMSDSQLHDFRRFAPLEWIKRRYVAQCQAGLVGGTRHRDYLARLGMSPERIYLGYDVVENEHFSRGARAARASADMLRARYGLPPRYFLASARFMPKKNLERLIGAFAEYRRRCRESAGMDARGWDLILLGDGASRPRLEALIARLGLEAAIHLPGFKQYDELPVYYGLAEAFVHASTTEQWGLVVNEAMAAGLPVLVSNACGCTPELVADGRNGYSFDPFDQKALATLLLRLAADDCDRQAMGNASREIVKRWSPDTFAEGLVGAAADALIAPRVRPRLIDRGVLWALGRR